MNSNFPKVPKWLQIITVDIDDVDECFAMANFKSSFQTSVKCKETQAILLRNCFKSGSDPSSASNYFVLKIDFCVHQTDLTKNAEATDFG